MADPRCQRLCDDRVPPSICLSVTLYKVMLAASYWSLLAPEIEIAEESGKYGAFAFLPVAVGFTLCVAFVYGADILMPTLGVVTLQFAAVISKDLDGVFLKQQTLAMVELRSYRFLKSSRVILYD
ncbi:Zinc transporter ZIP11 [Acipenser ruthenus]|uniref:Zinc transporter ZIP11 n=1 Tax=Acipenser ruthenus TaxID=7906 RepID=A0A444UF49_ACIRT|nr:Zinc transporter ZIP11 [Acipenser ruthenus]